MMLDLEIITKFLHHFIVQVGPVVDNLARNSIQAYDILLDKSSNHLFCHICIGSVFYPLGEVINGDQYESVSIRSI